MIRLARLDDRHYRLLCDDVPVGYVDLEGTVYVALLGEPHAHACEVGQSLSLDIAVSIVERAAAATLSAPTESAAQRSPRAR